MNFVHRFAYSVSNWNRGRKWELFQGRFSPDESLSILDVGFQDAQHQSADNYLEEHYEWPAKITALGIEEPVAFSQRYPEVKVVTYDGRNFPFEDGSFDIVWSNAVVEHVGDREAQVHFLRETRRVGKRVFLTTPNRWFPVEVHTRIPLLHWLPKRWFDWILYRADMKSFAGDYMRLLGLRELTQLLAEAGFTESIVVKNKLGGPTLDFVVMA